MADIKIKLDLNNGQNTIDIDRNKLTEVNSTSQMTAGPSGINYGSISNTGSFTINDYNDEIKSKIDDGTLDVSGVSVSVYEDNHLIQRHISRDSDYNNADKTFSVNLTNKLLLLDSLKYKGYTYQDAPITVYALLFDVLNNFYGGQLTSQDDVLYKDILSAYMIHPVTGQRIHIWEYAQDIVIKYPSIEYGRTYRDVINELCTILQCYMYVNDNDDLVFASARPLLENGSVSNAIRITKDKMYSPLKDAVILRNKYDGVEISEQQVGPRTIINDVVQTWGNHSSSSSDSDEKSGVSLGVGHIYNRVTATFWSGTIRIPKRSNDHLTTYDNIRTGEDDSGDAWIKHTVYYTHKTGTAGSGGVV